MSLTTQAVAVGTTPTRLTPASASSVPVLSVAVQNTGSTNVALGDSNVTMTNGWILGPGESVTVDLATRGGAPRYPVVHEPDGTVTVGGNDPASPYTVSGVLYAVAGSATTVTVLSAPGPGGVSLPGLTQDQVDARIPVVGNGIYVAQGNLGQQKLIAQQDAALRRIRADLALAATKRVNVLFIGHSMVGGYRVTKVGDMMHAAYTTAQMRRLGLTRSGTFFPPYNPGTVNASITDWPTARTDPHLTAAGHGLPPSTGTWLGTFNSTTYGPVTVTVPAGVGGLAIFTAPDSQQPPGKFQYSIDGGAATVVDTAADGNVTKDFYRITTVALDGNAHTVTIQGNTGLVALDGVELLTDTAAANAGIHGFFDAHPGHTSTQMVTDLNYGTQGAMLAGLNPSMVVYCGLVNDYSSGVVGANPVPSATSYTNVKTILQQFQTMLSTRPPSIVINIENQRNNNDAQMTEPWQNYIDAAYQAAADLGCAIYDGGKRFGGGAPGPAVTAGLLDGDTIHPAPAGMWTWGYGLAEFVSPR